jgi:chromosomal replication initiation ATPase DnaA
VTVARQLALPFPPPTHFAPQDFLPGPCHAEALAWLKNPGSWPDQRLAIHGEAGSGKTHLLHVFARTHEAAVITPCGIFLPPYPALAVDDADLLPDQEALLHLLNSAREHAKPVLLAARTPPAAWPFTLPDLVSRLRAITTVAITLPDDDFLRALLARMLAQRQLAVPERLQDYMLARLPRSAGILREAAARLDRLSLCAGRHVTQALVTAVITGLTGEDPATAPLEEAAP